MSGHIVTLSYGADEINDEDDEDDEDDDDDDDDEERDVTH